MTTGASRTESPGDGELLPLPARKVHAPKRPAQERVVSVGKSLHKLVGSALARRSPHVGVAGLAQSAKTDVIPDGKLIHGILLKDRGEIAVEFVFGNLLDVPPRQAGSGPN